MAWFEPAQECLAIGLAASWATNFLFEWNSLVFLLIHMLCWFLSDYTLLSITQNSKLPFSKFEYVITWLYRETICYYLFMKAAVNPTVQWRHGKYRLKWGGLAEEIVTHSNDNLKKQPLNILESQYQLQTPQQLRQEQPIAKLINKNELKHKIRHQYSHSASPVLLNFIKQNDTLSTNTINKTTTST